MSAEVRLMNVKEAASYTGFAESTLRKMICLGDLPFKYLKVGRRVLFDRRDLDEWADSLPRYGGVANGK